MLTCMDAFPQGIVGGVVGLFALPAGMSWICVISCICCPYRSSGPLIVMSQSIIWHSGGLKGWRGGVRQGPGCWCSWCSRAPCCRSLRRDCPGSARHCQPARGNYECVERESLGPGKPMGDVKSLYAHSPTNQYSRVTLFPNCNSIPKLFTGDTRVGGQAGWCHCYGGFRPGHVTENGGNVPASCRGSGLL